MNLFLIPLQPKAQTFTIPINSSIYRITLSWNYKSSWELDLATETRILSSIPLVFDTNLLRPFSYLNLGFTFLFRATNPNVVSSYDNLGTQTLLYLITL